MTRVLAGFLAFVLGLTPALADEENVSIRGNFPQLLARGETTPQMANRIAVALINLDSTTPITLRRGDRIAQLVVQRVELPELVEFASFDEAGLAETTRGQGGHGSSGGHASL